MQKNIFLRNVLLVFLLTAGLLLASSSSFAYPLAVSEGDTIYVTDHSSANATWDNGQGGAFVINRHSSESPWASFVSFCLELDEHIELSAGSKRVVYTIDSISNEALAGGVNTKSGDPISDFTRWLYAGVLGGQINATDYAKVQYAIWVEEEEISAAGLKGKDRAAYNQFQIWKNDFDTNGWGDHAQTLVGVLNLKTVGGENAQSVLAPVAVPEPAMALMLGGLLFGVGALGRRRFLKR